MTTLREERLANGLSIRFCDESNRYFGDYHRVRVVATLTFDLAHLPIEDPQRDEALRILGATCTTVRPLERMAVPSAEVERVRAALIEEFLASAGSYLARPSALSSLAAAALKARRTPRRYA